MLLPFSDRGKKWEGPAQALRRLVGVSPGEQIDPWMLAPKVTLTVVDLFKLPIISGTESQCLLQKFAKNWSGGVYPQELPDGTRVCILNPSHSRRRNKITLMEEIVHSYLNHKPTTVTLAESGVKVRDFNKLQEQEAYGIGAAVLIPWSSLFSLLNRGQTVAQLADHYDVTTDLVWYRIKITGAFRLYTARQQKYQKLTVKNIVSPGADA